MDIEKLNKLKPRNRNSTNAARNKLTTKKTKFVLCAQPSDKNNNLERLNSKLNSNFIQKLSLNQADEDNEISQIESFVFNEDEPQNVQELDEDNNDDDDDDEDDDDEDDEDDDDDGLNLLKNRPKTYAQIDNDTKLKLETLLANAGIESITSDLFKDPQIMQTLTTTYVRTLNEVVAKTKLKKSVSKSKSETKSINEVVESTFEEFILAAAAVAAASSSSNSTMSNNGDEDDDELTEADIQHHNYMIQKLDKSDKKSDSKSDKKSVTSSASSSSSSLKQTINSCIGNLTSPESLLNKLIDLKPDLANSDKEAIDALTQVANKKIAVGKSLTELLEENADSVLGLACASGYLELVSVLLAINSNSNLDTVSKSKIKNESTPLIEACSNGHEQIVELLLKHGANPNKKSSSGSSPLHYAIQNQHANIVKKLAETCKDAILIEQTNENGHTPLMEAASNGFLDCAKILVDIGQANVNTYSAEFKETALTLASYKGHVEVVKYLLEKGADCEHKTDEMHTALMEACMDGHIEVAKVLIEHGANVNMPADSFESPLTLAACGGHVELADLLIDNHADLEERNDEGYTPLMEAAREGHEEMVALLLFHDADINAITDETQETALTLACCGGCYEVAKFLLEAGADPNLGNASTPLMEAAQEGHLELVQLLIKAGADVNKFYTALITNGQNTTQNITSCESALSLACENGHTDVAAALIKAGAEADMADPDKGFTPLMKAARSGQLCTVQYLIGNCSVDVNRTTKNNESTALSLASSNGHIQLIELLLQHGANPLYVLKDNSNCLIEASKNGHVKIVELLIDWNYSLNEMDEAKKTKRKNLKINLKPKMTSQTHVHTGDQTLSPSSLSPSSSLVKQIRKSVTKLDTTSELGVENLVNVLHHFAFGDMTPSESKAKKKRNKDDISLVSIEEFCECKCQGNCNTEVMTADNDKLLHLSLSIGSQIDRGAEDEDDDDDDDQEDDDDDEGQGQGQGHTECDQERMNDEERVSSGGGGGGEGGGLGEQDEDEQIKKKENLLQELLKIEKQLEVQRKSKVKSHNSNYDHMSMINKYLIKRCQCELNRLYKIKLKQLQEQKINEIKADSKISKKCIAKKCGATTTSTTISTNNSTTTSTTTTTITNNTNNISNSSTPKSTTSDEWLPPPPPPFAAAAAYLIQQSMKSKASEQNAPHIDLDMATETNNDTALTVAVQGAHEDLVKLLIEKGAHIEHKDKKGYTPLILAASVGHHRIVQLLLVYGANVEAQSERNKDTALCVAAQNGKYECCEILLSKGQANKEHRNISDYTPLSLAASNGYVNIIKLLLSHGAEINSRTGSKLGISPLMLAAMNGHTHAVRFLIEAGSDVNSQIETNRNTALTLACFQGRADVVTLLLDKKANIEHRAKTGLTPLMEAASGGYDQVGRILLERGADENALPVPTTKDTALTIAAEKGHVKFVELLVQYGAHLEAKNKKGCSALWLACHAGHFDVVQTLVLNNADADSCDSRRTSCLVAAFKRGHLNICKFLVRHVKHFAPDQELTRHINSLLSTPDHDKQLAKKCHECMDVILKAKDKQAQEANKYASLLLKQLDQEKCREQSKKMAAQRKREKKKLKKKQIKHLELDQDQPQDQLQEQLEEQLQDQDEDEPTKQQHKDHMSTAAPCDSAKVQQHQQQQKEHQKEQEQEEQKEEEQEEQAIVASAKVVVKAEQQQQRKKKKKSSSQMHKKSSKLADLDDFEVCKQQQQQQHLASGATSTTSTNTTKLNDLDAFDLNDLSNFKQRVLLPSNRIDRITAMCTKSLSNIQVIQNLTKCTLKMEQVRLKSSVDKYVVVAGASLDQTKYACELVETLINDPLVNLANLLPSCSETEWSVGPPVAASKPKHKTPAAALHKPNTAHNTAPVPPHTNDVKPRNFAEAVAKPVNWTRRHSVSPAKPDKKMDKPVQIVVPIGKQDNEPAVKHPGAPPSAPLPAKIEFASVGQHDQAYQPLISNKVIDQVLSDILSPSFSQVNHKPLSSPSLNLNEPMLTRPTKPIGYERHEKQFRNSNQNLDHNHANVNQNNWMVNNSMDLLSSFNHQMLFSSQMSMVPNSQAQFNPGQFNPGMYQNFHKPVTPPMPIGHINPAMINYTGSYANFPANQAPLIQHNHMFNPSASLMPHSIQNAPNQQQSLIDSFFFSSKSTGFNFNNF